MAARAAVRYTGQVNPTKILCTGDIHLGTSSTGLRERLSVAPIWTEVIPELARREGVELVVLTGDVVEHANRVFEAYGVLRTGLERLLDAGIDVVAVSGNHDYDVLPQLADALRHPRFWLLGRNATWERRAWPDAAAPRLYLEGWSFPERGAHVRNDPLRTYALAAPSQPGVPRIGILHGDLEPSGGVSNYAPLSCAGLTRTGVDAWLLGHIHSPGPRQHSPLILYPGSPQALDPSEQGEHGPWLVEVYTRGNVRARQLAASPVRYERMQLDVSGCTNLPEVLDLIQREAAKRAEAAAQSEGLPPAWLHLRLTLMGATTAANALRQVPPQDWSNAEFAVGAVRVVFDSEPTLLVREPFDMRAVAADANPLGELARRVLELEAGGAAAAPHLAAAREVIQTVWQAPAYADLPPDPPSDDELREWLLAGAYALAEAMVRQRQQDVDA